MDWLKDAKPLLDLGVTAMGIVFAFVLVMRPPSWIRSAVESHHELAAGVRTLSEAMPKREEVQELLIGQEALRRESHETRQEVRQAMVEIRDLRRAFDGRG